MSEKADSQESIKSEHSSEFAVDANQLESLIEISGSSVDSNDRINPLGNQEEVKLIVLQILEKLESKCDFEDIKTLMSLIIPKVLFDNQAYENLSEEVKTIKQTLNSYMQHSKVVSEDIAEIFLDLHNIYSKLEKYDKCEKIIKKDTKFNKRISEANQLLKSNKHFINNDQCDFLRPSETLDTSSTSNVSSTIQRDENVASRVAMKAEKRAFLTNMVMAKKSDYSLDLNRHKQFYQEAEKALKSNQKPTKESS